jgi:hypothetical protein
MFLLMVNSEHIFQNKSVENVSTFKLQIFSEIRLSKTTPQISNLKSMPLLSLFLPAYISQMAERRRPVRKCLSNKTCELPRFTED